MSQQPKTIEIGHNDLFDFESMFLDPRGNTQSFHEVFTDVLSRIIYLQTKYSVVIDIVERCVHFVSRGGKNITVPITLAKSYQTSVEKAQSSKKINEGFISLAETNALKSGISLVGDHYDTFQYFKMYQNAHIITKLNTDSPLSFYDVIMLLRKKAKCSSFFTSSQDSTPIYTHQTYSSDNSDLCLQYSNNELESHNKIPNSTCLSNRNQLDSELDKVQSTIEANNCYSSEENLQDLPCISTGGKKLLIGGKRPSRVHNHPSKVHRRNKRYFYNYNINLLILSPPVGQEESTFAEDQRCFLL